MIALQAARVSCAGGGEQAGTQPDSVLQSMAPPTDDPKNRQLKERTNEQTREKREERGGRRADGHKPAQWREDRGSVDVHISKQEGRVQSKVRYFNPV